MSSGNSKQRGVSPLEIANDIEYDLQTEGGGDDASSTTIEEQYHLEREQAKLRHWKESDFAAGLVEPTWSDEFENYRRAGGNCVCCCCCCPSNGVEMGQVFYEEMDPGCGCIYLSAVVCSRLGAGRIGNMAVLKERYVMVEVDYDDDECEEDVGGERVDGFVDDNEGEVSLHQRNGGDSRQPTKAKRFVRKRDIQLVLGPFWPMLLFITYPLIFAVSAWTLYSGIPGQPWFVQAGWAMLTLLLIRSLFNTGFRDPGILKRYTTPPDGSDIDDDDESRQKRRLGFRWGNEEGPWRWTDQVQSYRPKNSMYCTDCKVVIEEFDHTCPWTGTAIGKKNMGSFQMFVGLVFLCLIMDIFLLTAGAVM